MQTKVISNHVFYAALSVPVMSILVVVPAAIFGNELQKTLTAWHRSNSFPVRRLQTNISQKPILRRSLSFTKSLS